MAAFSLLATTFLEGLPTTSGRMRSTALLALGLGVPSPVVLCATRVLRKSIACRAHPCDREGGDDWNNA